VTDKAVETEADREELQRLLAKERRRARNQRRELRALHRTLAGESERSLELRTALRAIQRVGSPEAKEIAKTVLEEVVTLRHIAKAAKAYVFDQTTEKHEAFIRTTKARTSHRELAAVKALEEGPNMGADAAPSQKAQELTRAFAQATAALLNNQLGPVMIDGAELAALRKAAAVSRKLMIAIWGDPADWDRDMRPMWAELRDAFRAMPTEGQP
jgi:hypothetical protein